MIDNEILKKCKFMVEKDLGDLNDLPKELANTFVNFYYRVFELEKKLEGKSNSHLLDDNNDIIQSMKDFSFEFHFILEHFKRIPDYVYHLREIKIKEPEGYEYIVNLYLDILKFRIDDAHNKSEIRRRLERLLHRKKVNEIPNLIQMLNP